MATAPEAAMMDMPQEAAPNPFSDPNTMDVYDQMRQSVSPKEFGDEVLAGASQVDPQEVAKFKAELDQLDVPMEVLDMLNNMVDEILANPDNYEQVKQKYEAMGVTEDLLPAQFDPHFFSALNMAVDQMVAEPAGAQAFARGGIAELTPISKAIANYGRNGDTMLAHITPAEARMLRRRGGAGTTNPHTGLKEYFSLGKLFKGIGNAIKSFASSTVGKIVTTVALGFFLGPAAASFMSVTSAAGVAAVSGFVGSAGSTLLGGGNLKDALKAGAIGGLTAGAIGGVTQGFDTAYAGPTTVGGQVDKFTNMISPSGPTPSGIQAPAIDASGNVKGLTTIPEQTINPLDRQYATPAEIARVENMNPAYASDETLARQQSLGASPENQFTAKKVSVIPDGQGGVQAPPNTEVRPFTDASGKATSMGTFPTNSPVGAPYDPATATRAVDYGYKPGGAGSAAYQTPTIGESFSKMGEGLGMGNDPASFKTFMEGAGDLFAPGPNDAQITTRAQEIMRTTPGATLKDAMAAASKELSPTILRSYGPAAAAGIGALALGGGFKPTSAAESTLRPELMKPVTQRIAEGGNQRNYYMQGLPGVKYDQYGAPIFGQYKPLPTFDTGLGIESLINPRGYAAGGAADKVFDINNFDQTAYLNAHPDVKEAIARGEIANAYEHYTKFGKAEGRTAFDKTETAAQAAKDATEKEAAQAANKKLVADATAARKAAGFGNAYQNINAGLSYDVPAGIAATSIAARQAAFKPTMDKFTQAQTANAATLAKPYTPTVVDQPYNNTTGYTNVLNPVAPKINYDTTPELTAAQKAAADKAIADKLAADKAAADAAANMTAAQKAAADKAAADKAAADKLAAAKAAADKLAADKLAAAKAAADKLAADKLAADKAIADKLAADRAAAAKVAADKAIADRTLFQGQSAATQNQQIMDYLKANPNATDRTLVQQMDYFGIKPSQVAQVTGMQGIDPSSFQNIDFRYADAKSALQGNPNSLPRQNQADAVTGKSIQDFFAKNPGMGDEQIANYMDRNMIDPRQMEAAFAGTAGAVSAPDVLKRYNAAITGPTRKVFPTDDNSFMTPPAAVGGRTFIPDARLPEGMSGTMGGSGYDPVTGRMDLGSAGGSGQYVNSAEVPKKLLNMGGIASLGSGGYPRRTGQISGPGTATSDSIPAMLSDGEFVMTARAVRGAGKGDKRAGAKRMYALMNQLEKNAARG